MTIPDRNAWEETRKDELLPNNALCVYTDGSRMENHTGAGVHFSFKEGMDLSIALGRVPTVFQAEVYAILAAVTSEALKDVRNQIICIFADSQAALGALQHHRVTSKLVQTCFQELNVLAAHNDVRLVWIPGHRGLEGNELADELARTGSSMAGPDNPFIGASVESFKTAVKGWVV